MQQSIINRLGIENKTSINPIPQYSPWLGGSLALSTPGFDEYLITRLEYEEYGEEIITRQGNKDICKKFDHQFIIRGWSG